MKNLIIIFWLALIGAAYGQNVGPSPSAVPTGAWTSYSPTIVCGSGAVGAYSRQNGFYQQIGKALFLSIDVQAAAGTCSGTQSIPLPNSLSGGGGRQVMSAMDDSTQASLTGLILLTASSVQLFTAAGGNPTVGDNFIVTGTIQTQ